jgi:hypothetical protein
MPMQPVEQAPAPAPPPPKASTGDIVLAVVVLIAIAMVGGFVWMWLRRRLFQPESPAGPATLMEDLRRMRDEGQITQEEYDTIRRNMAARLAKSGFGDTKPEPGSKPPRDGR